MSEVVTSLPIATLIIMAIAAGIAFLNSGINRVLINYFVGWEQYRVMQREMGEYRSETMAAMRAKDTKKVEKLKKKDSQIKNMQAKMMKPQMVQFGISFVYLIVWFLVLTPTFHQAPNGLHTRYWYNCWCFPYCQWYYCWRSNSCRDPRVLLVPHLLTIFWTFVLTHNRYNAHRTRRSITMIIE